MFLLCVVLVIFFVLMIIGGFVVSVLGEMKKVDLTDIAITMVVIGCIGLCASLAVAAKVSGL